MEDGRGQETDLTVVSVSRGYERGIGHSQNITQGSQLLLSHMALSEGVPVQLQQVVLPIEAAKSQGSLCSEPERNTEALRQLSLEGNAPRPTGPRLGGLHTHGVGNL